MIALSQKQTTVQRAADHLTYDEHEAGVSYVMRSYLSVNL